MKEKLRDDLTGCFNYKQFNMDYEKAIAEAKENCTPLSIGLIDLDFFKKANDNYGHEAGDEILINFSNHLKTSFGDSAVVYRYGGEEFAVIFPETEKEEAFLLMENARRDYSGEFKFKKKNKTEIMKITFSGGVGTFIEDGTTDKEILRKADEALYRAKMTGRNKICLAREEKMVPKTSYYTHGQLMRLNKLAKAKNVVESILLREALDDIFKKYKMDL